MQLSVLPCAVDDSLAAARAAAHGVVGVERKRESLSILRSLLDVQQKQLVATVEQNKILMRVETLLQQQRGREAAKVRALLQAML
jgi:hypothetical protein